MPELTGNDTSFAFMSSPVIFLVFNMASAAILGHHFEFENQGRPKILDLQSQN